MITKKFRLLKDDPDTGAILQPLRVLCAYRRDTNLFDSLVRSTPKGSVKLNVNGPSFGWIQELPWLQLPQTGMPRFVLNILFCKCS